MGLLRFIFTGQWNKAPDVEDNREDWYVDENGNAVGIEYTGAILPNGQTNAINHEEKLHNGTPHTDPAVYDSLNPITNLAIGPVAKGIYPLTISEDGRHADLDELRAYADSQNGILNLANGRRVRVVELRRRDRRKLERQEDRLQRRRGVKQKNLRRRDRRRE